MQKAKVFTINEDTTITSVTGILISQDAEKVVLDIDGTETSFDKNMVSRIQLIDNKPKAEKAAKAPREKSAKVLAAEQVVRENPGMARKEQIALLRKMTGMSQAGASTYHQNARKALGLVKSKEETAAPAVEAAVEAAAETPAE